MVGAHWRSTASRISPVEAYYANVQLPEKGTLTGTNSFCWLPFSPVRRSNMVVEWRRNDVPITANFSWLTLSQQRLLLGPQQISGPDRAGTLRSVFQFGLWNARGCPAVGAQNLLVLPVRNGLLYVEGGGPRIFHMLQSKNIALAPPLGAGRGHR